MQVNVSIRYTTARSSSTGQGTTGKIRPMTEREFRSALARMLVATADVARPLTAAAFQAAGAEIEEHFSDDVSFLGTFTTIAEEAYQENRVPDGCECPRCGQDQMDSIMPQENGDCLCDCGALYSGDTSCGRPAWFQFGQGARRYYYVPAANRYVTIPSD